MAWDERITIDAPPDKVFEYVADFTRHGEWSGHGLTATKVTDGPVAVGTTFKTEAKQFGTQREQSTVTDLTPPSRFEWESVGALGRVRHAFSLREDDGSTVVTKSAQFIEPKFFARLMMRRIGKDLPKALREDLIKIKAAVEGSAL